MKSYMHLSSLHITFKSNRHGATLRIILKVLKEIWLIFRVITDKLTEMVSACSITIEFYDTAIRIIYYIMLGVGSS